MGVGVERVDSLRKLRKVEMLAGAFTSLFDIRHSVFCLFFLLRRLRELRRSQNR